jgi:hypothetical protein
MSTTIVPQITEQNAWDVLESLIGKIDAPTDWSSEHDHYLYVTPKQQQVSGADARFVLALDILKTPPSIVATPQTSLPEWADRSPAESLPHPTAEMD